MRRRRLRRAVRFLRRLVQAMFRLSMQMAYLGYYGDRRTFASVGYVPFSERPATPSARATCRTRCRA